MRIGIDIAAEDLAESLVVELGYDDLLNLLCEVDLKVADVGFTESLIKRLAVSIVRDYEGEQYRDLLRELHAFAPPVEVA